MAKTYQFNVPAHASIYEKNERNLEIYFSEPEIGINEDTGILLLIPGFGGNANSNIYKKMRLEFADKYNLVTIQCDYFGWEFMQQRKEYKYNINVEELSKIFTNEDLLKVIKNNSIDFYKLLQVGNKYEIHIEGEEILNETLGNFNDMGIMQAIDNITAVLLVIAIINDNGYKFNSKKIILYGNSQGAYISYLCNAFAPELFTLLIDNSSWLFPVYLKQDRIIGLKYGKLTDTTRFHYLASDIEYDEELLYLVSLYKKFNNNCNMVVFHGDADELISNTYKRKFCFGIEKCIYNEISKDKLDGKIFKSTEHGLDADFIYLFDYVMNSDVIKFNKGNRISIPNVEIKTSKYIYNIDYSKDVPIMSRVLI